MRQLIWIIVILAAFAAASQADAPLAAADSQPTFGPSIAAAPTDQPPDRPATDPAETQPATDEATSAPTKPAPTDPAVIEILNKLEAAGPKHRTIRSDVEMHITDRLTGDSELRTGWLSYRKADEKTPAGFRVHFDTLKLGESPAIKDEVDYAFDGHFFTVAKHKIKDMQRYQVAAEDEQAEPMKLGKGPFPLPFGQKTADVLERFEATTREVKPSEPAGTVFLQLQPRREHYETSDFVKLEMWVDPQTYLPVKLTSRDKNKKTTTITFKDLKTNVDVDEKMFHMPQPAGWTYRVERLEQPE